MNPIQKCPENCPENVRKTLSGRPGRCPEKSLSVRRDFPDGRTASGFCPDNSEVRLPKNWGELTCTERNAWLSATVGEGVYWKRRTRKFHASAWCDAVQRTIAASGVSTLAEALRVRDILRTLQPPARAFVPGAAP